MSEVYLGLGSNLGDRCANIRAAISLINRLEFTSVDRVSNFYFNWAQEWAGGEFVNVVSRIHTLLDPYSLLFRLQFIEKRLGRIRKYDRSPRTIDIDILLYDNLRLDSPELKIPHPRMWDRDFVILPLSELVYRLSGVVSNGCYDKYRTVTKEGKKS